jgi:hypothetical protein
LQVALISLVLTAAFFVRELNLQDCSWPPIPPLNNADMLEFIIMMYILVISGP